MPFGGGRARRALALTLAGVVAACAPPTPVEVSVRVDPDTTHQTFAGFEVVAQGGQFECAAFPTYRDELVRRAVDFGVDRVRLEVVAGCESDVDHHARFAAGEITFDDWHATFYDVVNDDGDPRRARAGGFHFGGLDATVRELVLPLRADLRAATPPRHLYVNLCYVAFHEGGAVHRADPEEYAEFIRAAFDHLRSTFDLVPDGLEILLEPDAADWEPGPTAALLPAVTRRLAEGGFDPAIHYPSTKSLGGAQAYLDAAAAVPGALDAVDVVTYHRYADAGSTALADLAGRARALGKSTAMLEHIGSGIEDLLTDVLDGGNVSWQQFALAFPTRDDGAQLFTVEVDDAGTGRLVATERGRALQHAAPLLGQGSVRVDLTTDHADVRGLAVRRGGGIDVCLHAARPAVVRLTGLPAGRYQEHRTGDDGSRVAAGPPRDVDDETTIELSLGEDETLRLAHVPR